LGNVLARFIVSLTVALVSGKLVGINEGVEERRGEEEESEGEQGGEEEESEGEQGVSLVLCMIRSYYYYYYYAVGMLKQ